MTTQKTLSTDEPKLHNPLLLAMLARGLRLVEMDQIIYPELVDGSQHRGGPSHSRVYLQVLDADRHSVASGTYEHPLSHVQSPFMGPQAIPGSPRYRLMDELVKTLEASAVVN